VAFGTRLRVFSTRRRRHTSWVIETRECPSWSAVRRRRLTGVSRP
jgi:hypothetical protein